MSEAGPTAAPRLALAMVHHPVVDKNGRVIAAALTPTDLHDLARSCRTYGVAACWMVTPLKDQIKLAERMLGFWRTGVGADYNPNRGQALDLIRLAASLDEAVAAQTAAFGQRPELWATAARRGLGVKGERRLEFSDARDRLAGGRPTLVLLGTAWGLAPEVLEACDEILAPIEGAGEYNHLSVRSAAAVALDRLLAQGR